ncbi:MAG: gliding motility-associated C-terminal domain-containing protein [Chitinophagales bacterium]
MKKGCFLLALVAIYFGALGQELNVKQFNFSTFTTDKKVTPEALVKRSSTTAKQHPEFGILPFNAPCSDCVELLDKRTENTRFFIDPEHPNRSFSQSSYFPLNYKTFKEDVWHTIDTRLKPDSTRPGVYVAKDQPVPTALNMNDATTSIIIPGFEFVYSRNLSMYFYDRDKVETKSETGNYKDYTVGDEGVQVKNIWPGINLQHTVGAGQIKTNYVITQPLQLPISKGFMVIEDHFTLPQGFTFTETGEGEYSEDGVYYTGDYCVKNQFGYPLITYKKPVFVDAISTGMPGSYQLLKINNDYTLRTFVPVDWLNRKENVYPIFIDPNVLVGADSIGHFQYTTLPSANMAFTTQPASCDYHMTVTVPGMTQLKQALVDVEYTLTFNPACGTPPLPSPFCQFNMASMEVLNDSCNQSTGPLSCNPAQPPFTGTCTTDSLTVPGASALLINNFNPNYLNCYEPQCPDYHIPFTLKNRDASCGDVCGYLCARGNYWRMTVTGCTVEGNITQDKTVVCPGDPITFTVHPDCGVPPYHYVWVSQGGNQLDTLYGTTNFVVNPQVDGDVFCVIIDTCGVEATTNLLSYTISPAPPADAGPDANLCAGGGQVFLGGNPTSTGGVNTIWKGETPTQTAWLSSTTDPNPVANIPAGTVDTFYYTVTCSSPGFTCSRTDTVRVFAQANPVAVIDSTGPLTICENQLTGATVVGSYASYLWNTGATTQAISINQPGLYFAIVTDAQGCKDTTNALLVSSIAPPNVTVFPDTLIMYGDSVILYTDLNLGSASIDSFEWYPVVNISCTSCPNPVVAPLNDQYYGISVYANGCSNSDSALIRVILPNNFYIPNVFTPNGDGNNDNFYIFSQSGVRVLSFQVFDRIGEKVHDGSYPWDGNYKGKPAPPGVYVYVFKLGLFGDDRAVFRKGSVTLIR